MATLQIGCRVEVVGKGVQGEVAYLGTTGFATGKWVGVSLDEPKGKNNGSVQGKTYFQCKENHGMFVRQSQLVIIDELGNRLEILPGNSPASSIATSPDDIPRSGMRSRLSSSRQSLLSRSRGEFQSREDVTLSVSQGLNVSEPNSKRSSFIETGFVETLKPQFTPGQVLASPSPMQTPTGAQLHAPGLRSQAPAADPEELQDLKEKVTDLSEKLETIRIKYKEKSHEAEQLRLQLDQAQEFKLKIMEAQTALKKELERARQERDKAVEAREDMADIAETLELITLDKEMAEEKVESLQTELDQAKEKLEELALDYQLLKEEMSEKRGDSDQNAPTSYEMKQLEQQNARLRDTLVRMRDLAAHEKHEMLKLTRDLEAKKNENADLVKANEKLLARTAELDNQVTDLHEQVDAALGAEEMVEQLGHQKLVLEDRVKELEETVQDLEALQEVNDQLQEDSKELEMDLREEVDMAHAAAREALKQKESILESLADRELTIVKFRELVHKLQEQNQDLRMQLEKESSSKSAVAQVLPEMLDFKKMFAESKAHARAIDLELRRLEVQQSQQHVQYLAAFMPDSFMNRGGDNDAVLVLLFFPRLLWKCEVLLSQLKNKFPAVANVTSKEIVQGHTVQQFSSRCYMAMHLHSLQAILRQFHDSLNSCSPEVLLKVGASFPDMALQEKTLDGYIDLHKRDQLDENVNTDSLEKCINYFVTMHPLLLLANPENNESILLLHQSHLVNDLGKALQAACDSVRTDAAIVQALMKPGSDPTDVALLCQHLSTVTEVVSQHLKQIRRRLAVCESETLPLPSGVDVANCYRQMARVAKLTREVARAALSQIGNTPEGDTFVDMTKLSDVLTAAWDKIFDGDNSGPVANVKSTAAMVASSVAQVAQALLDWEPSVQPSKEEKPAAPITLRAKQVKSELEETKALRTRLEAREADIRELKMTLRTKQEESGELQVRKDLLEKRLTNTSQANEKLERKLEDALKQMRRKEKEFEETMDHLQADIDSLESERGELKEKLKNYSKKVFIEGVKSSVVNATIASTEQNTTVRESPLLLNEIRSLRTALKNEQSEKFKLQVDHMKKQLAQLKPIIVPKRHTSEELEQLIFKTQTLKNDLRLARLVPVIDISKERPGEPSMVYENHVSRQHQKQRELQQRMDSLKIEVTNYIVKHKRGGRVETDLTTFPIPEMSKALKETEPVVIGEIILPRTDNDTPNNVTVYLDSIEQIKHLQDRLFKFTVGV